MTALLALIPAPLWRFLGWLTAGVAALGGVFLMGRREGTQQGKTEAAEAVSKTFRTQKDVSDEIAALSDDAVSDALREWMRSGP